MDYFYRSGTHSFPAETSSAPAAFEQPDEVLVADVRAGLTPSEMVERKLLRLLHGARVAGSHVRMAGLERRRGPDRAHDGSKMRAKNSEQLP